MTKNKLYTLSYFRMRLKEAGIRSKILIPSYPEQDARYWTIVIDPAMSLMCSCLKSKDDFSFVIYADFNANNYNSRFTTESMETIIAFLKNVQRQFKEQKKEPTPNVS